MAFTVVSASAGSGKTYNLTQSVITLLFKTHPGHIRHILALTFTNKAANEMKEKLLERLEEIRDGKAGNMISRLREETGMDEKAVKEKAGEILHHLLFHYDDLSFGTIDRFTFGIIRQFARELGLSAGINVEMQQEQITDAIIEQFLNRLDNTHPVTQELKKIIWQKIANDEKWDVFDELKKLKKYILPDKYLAYIETLHQFSPADIREEKEKLFRKRENVKKRLRETLEELEELLSRPEISEKVKNFKYYLSLLNNLKKDLVPPQQRNKSFENLFLSGDVSSILKSKKQLDPRDEEAISRLAREASSLMREHVLLNMFLRALNPLSLMHAVTEEIKNFKEDHDVIFISDFNKIINRVIKGNPSPFIYFRAGEKYYHHFIDEFQDTSVLQWENMQPLIGESLSKEINPLVRGSARIYGDAKQSIYRFRGGYPEQFIRLAMDEKHPLSVNPFPQAKKYSEKLPANWRSGKKIVRFNNRFFTDIVPFFGLQSELYRNPYQKENVEQEARQKHEGYVEIRLNNKVKELFLEEIGELVEQLIKNDGYKPGDIGILFNTNIEGEAIAGVLAKKGFYIESENSLKLSNSLKINLLISLYRFFAFENPQDLYEALRLYQSVEQRIFPTEEYQTFKGKNFEEVIKILSKRKKFPSWKHLDLYGFFSALIDLLELHEGDEVVYLKVFMSHLNGLGPGGMSPSEFLVYWETVLQNETPQQPPAGNAVRLMTVHKAKGLQFPVVIYAFANSILKPDENNLVWIDTRSMTKIPFLPVRFQDLYYFNKFWDTYSAEYDSFYEASVFDLINKIYVAFTRPQERLYVLAGNETRGNLNTNQAFTQKLEEIHPVLPESRWDEEEKIFRYGEAAPPLSRREEQPSYQQTGFYAKYTPYENPLIHFDTRPWELWRENKREAIRKGLTLHRYLARIHCMNDWPSVQERILREQGEEKGREIIRLLEKILLHPRLSGIFDCQYRSLNERPVLATEVYRPDRMILKENNRMVLVDYKTGKENAAHVRQLKNYAKILAESGYEVEKSMLVYIGDEPRVVEI